MRVCRLLTFWRTCSQLVFLLSRGIYCVFANNDLIRKDRTNNEHQLSGVGPSILSSSHLCLSSVSEGPHLLGAWRCTYVVKRTARETVLLCSTSHTPTISMW